MRNPWISTAFMMLSALFYGQEKKVEIKNSEQIFGGIFPNETVTGYKIVSKKYANEKILKSKGDFFHFPQFKGIKFNPSDDHYFYIAYQRGNEVVYITDLATLSAFMGTINSPQEAVLLAMSKGYFPDFEHHHFAGNYEMKNGEYHFELSKVTSEQCPYAKNNFLLSVNSSTQEVKELKDISRYFVIYHKDCTNHPLTAEVEKQMEEVKRQREQKAKEQKEINAKMEKRIRKIQRKHNR